MQFLDTVKGRAKSDDQLSAMLSMTSEYAEIYLLAKERLKGCDGMGELVTIKEEFRDVIDKVIQYCKEKGYISEKVSYDIDTIAEEIVKDQDPL